MRVLFVLATILAVAALAAPAMAAPGPAIEWQRLLGGSGMEYAVSMAQTTDGGYVLFGFSGSSTSGDVTGSNHGSHDYWVVKLDGAGAVQWQRLMGGDWPEQGFTVAKTADGGCVLLGLTTSSQSFDVTDTNHGRSDLWVVKLDSVGSTRWQRLLGGSGYEYEGGIQQTADGGYILTSRSTSSANGDVTDPTHDTGWYTGDVWLVKLNGLGQIEWQHLLGGSETEWGYSVQQTADSGYILLGGSLSSATGTVTGNNHGPLATSDLWVVKLNGSGGIEWQHLLGGTGKDWGYSVQQTADGGYILLGSSESSGSGDVTETSHGGSDFWVIRLNAAGGTEWQHLLGGSDDEQGRSVRQTADGGFILVGESRSSASGDVAGANNGVCDYWVVKLDGAGTVQWQRLLGGESWDYGYAGLQASDGGYLLLGYTNSTASGDVTGSNHGSGDFWVVKLFADAPATVPGGSAIPRDLNGDGKYEDVNGNGRKDFADVVLFFNQMTWIAANEPVSAFDYNANGRVDFADVVWLFTHL